MELLIIVCVITIFGDGDEHLLDSNIIDILECIYYVFAYDLLDLDPEGCLDVIYNLLCFLGCVI